MKPPDLGHLGLVTTGVWGSWAIFDAFAAPRYRYMLGRAWQSNAPTAVWVMLNPSSAGAKTDDPTIRKVRRFTSDLGCGGFVVVNLFAMIATDPRQLHAAAKDKKDISGPHNAAVLQAALDQTRSGPPGSRVIAAWGRFPSKTVERLADLPWSLVRRYAPMCYGWTDAGEPRHPLMLAYATKLERVHVHEEKTP